MSADRCTRTLNDFWIRFPTSPLLYKMRAIFDCRSNGMWQPYVFELIDRAWFGSRSCRQCLLQVNDHPISQTSQGHVLNTYAATDFQVSASAWVSWVLEQAIMAENRGAGWMPPCEQDVFEELVEVGFLRGDRACFHLVREIVKRQLPAPPAVRARFIELYSDYLMADEPILVPIYDWRRFE